MTLYNNGRSVAAEMAPDAIGDYVTYEAYAGLLKQRDELLEALQGMCIELRNHNIVSTRLCFSNALILEAEHS